MRCSLPRPNRDTVLAYAARRKIIIDARILSDRLGIGLGEVIHAITNWVGIDQCPRCIRWQVALDKLRVTGWKLKWAEVTDRIENKYTPGRIRVTWFDVN